MSQSSQNPYSTWMDMNGNMVDMWSKWFSQITPQSNSNNTNPMAAYFDFLTRGVSQAPTFSFVSGGNMADQMQKQWQSYLQSMSGFIPNQDIREGFERFMKSFQLFGSLQNFWDTFVKGMPTEINDWSEFMQPVLSNYQQLWNGFMQPFMPDQLKSLFVTPFESITAIQSQLNDFFKPWMENASEINGHFMKAMAGDKDAYTEFLKSWTELYKESASKILNMPTVGLSRASTEKMMKLMDYYVNFSVKMNEYGAIISNLLSETMENLMKNLQDLQAEGKQPQTFLEFYKIWSSVNEKAFETLFATEDFSKLMNETISVGSKLKLLFDDFLQDVLAPLPIPNRRELDNVEEEVYKLRKRIKALEKEIKAVKDAQVPAKS